MRRQVSLFTGSFFQNQEKVFGVFISRLIFQNFRNFEHDSFSLGAETNCIWGGNGAGKSNLLEAIFLLTTGRPSKATRDGELIRFGENVGRVEARVQKQGRELILEAALERVENFYARKTLKFNNQPIRKLSELLGQVKVVLFTPQDAATIQGEPSLRRRLIDLALSQISSTYLHHLQQYQAVREQRNSLLKRPHASSELIPWNLQLIEFGSQVLLKRLDFIPHLCSIARTIHFELSDGETLALSYEPSFFVPESIALGTIQEAFEKALQMTAEEESYRKNTLVGPHRDDLGITLDGIDARLFGSQGQQKTVALSLKLALGRLFAELDHESPVYLLDDCFSELDPLRQEAVKRIFEPGSQSVLTFALPPPPFASKHASF